MLEMIDDLQRLGIAYHFQNEIRDSLKMIYYNYYETQNKWDKMDLNLKALGFRLLRQHGYQVPQEIFLDFEQKTQSLKPDLEENMVGMLNLYEASYHSYEGESILDDARDLTTEYLKNNLEMINGSLLSLVSHSLELPLHWRVPWVEAKWFMEVYEKRSGMNPKLMEFSKLNFDMVQAIHIEDLKHASSLGRRTLTKVNSMITAIDDVYDVYGSLDELEQFTDVISRWEIKMVEDLPDYMKICFLGFYNTINEIAYNTLTNTGFLVLPYLTKAWAGLCKACLEEARWYYAGYTPTLQEYLDNAYESVSGPVILMHVNFLTADDLGTSLDELARGDTSKSIQCYMHERGATEDEARTYIKNLIMETWKKLNKERASANSQFSQEFFDHATNIPRMAQFMYSEGDGHGRPDLIKGHVFSLLFKPSQGT
nr:R-linalool synthase QH1, chloroplastic-like [Tanacetum cinerariifolium]